MTQQNHMPALSAELFVEGQNCTSIGDADCVGWCIDGEDYFRALHESLCHARREILIVGWDIDSRVALLRDETSAQYPVELCALLEKLVEEKPDLTVRVLAWDFAVIYMLERELFPASSFGWSSSDRLHFELDSEHASGASHHQKLVVIDGMLAFCGGIDLTKGRWDTRKHAQDEPRRTDPNGKSYAPFHDVQAVVSGPAAANCREIVSQRWKNAGGAALPSLVSKPDVYWPSNTAVVARNVKVGWSRTVADGKGDDDVQEILQLHQDVIRAAQRFIYIENQYFTSERLTESLAARLQEERGPEIVIVLPGMTSGWLEQATMDTLRDRAVQSLIDADKFGRLRVLTPVSDDLEDLSIYVHAKVLIADGELASVGSANLSRRSMGLDTECNLLVCDADAATTLCAELLAEHLGAEPRAVKEILHDGPIAVLERFAANARRLERLEVDTESLDQDILESVAPIADLEKPIMRDSDETSGGVVVSRLVRGLLLLFLVALAGFWVYVGLHRGEEGFTLESVLGKLRLIADHPFAPFAALPIFLLGAQLLLPVLGLVALTALLFNAKTAIVIGLAGILLTTVISHQLGSKFRGALMRRIPDMVTDKISSFASSSDVWALTGLRLIPIAPFTVVNLVVGASGISLRTFLLATLISMSPGTLIICLSVDRARAALSGEPIFEPWLIAAIIVTGISLMVFRIAKQSRKRRAG